MKNNQPSKNDLETISKQMLDTIINSIRSKMQLTQWRNTTSVITWFSNIEVFDIVQLEILISELLRRPLKYSVHSHSKKETLLFDKNELWVSRGDSPMFDVAMGCYDEADVCKLVGLIYPI